MVRKLFATGSVEVWNGILLTKVNVKIGFGFGAECAYERWEMSRRNGSWRLTKNESWKWKVHSNFRLQKLDCPNNTQSNSSKHAKSFAKKELVFRYHLTNHQQHCPKFPKSSCGSPAKNKKRCEKRHINSTNKTLLIKHLLDKHTTKVNLTVSLFIKTTPKKETIINHLQLSFDCARA